MELKCDSSKGNGDLFINIQDDIPKHLIHYEPEKHDLSKGEGDLDAELGDLPLRPGRTWTLKTAHSIREDE